MRSIAIQMRTHIAGVGADELDAGENKVGRAVEVERHQPRVRRVHKAVRVRVMTAVTSQPIQPVSAAEGAHVVGQGNGAREVLVEVDVENVVDEADRGDAVVSAMCDSTLRLCKPSNPTSRWFMNTTWTLRMGVGSCCTARRPHTLLLSHTSADPFTTLPVRCAPLSSAICEGMCW